MTAPRPDEKQLVDLDRAVATAISEFKLDRGFARTLRAMTLRESDDWMICCDGGCDPCVLTLEQAVNSIRKRLDWLKL